MVYSQPRTSVLKFGKVKWPTLVDSHVAREISILFPLTGADIKPGKAGELPVVWYSWELRHARSCFVDREHKAFQWQKNSTAETPDVHPNRCVHKSLGSTLQWNLSREEWSEKEQGHHINVLEFTVVKPYFLSTHPVGRVKYIIFRFLVACQKINLPNDFS